MTIKNPTNQIVLFLVIATAVICAIFTFTACNEKVQVEPPKVITTDTIVPTPIDTTDYNKVFYCQPDLDSLIQLTNKQVKDNETSENFGLFKARGRSAALLGFKKRSANNCVPHAAAVNHLESIDLVLRNSLVRWNDYKHVLYVIDGKKNEELTDAEKNQLRMLHLRYEQAKAQYKYAFFLYNELKKQ